MSDRSQPWPLIVPRDVRAPAQCGNCLYSWTDPEGELNCRRHPPTAFLVIDRAGPRINTSHPIVEPTSWCGEWTNGDSTRTD